MVIPPLRSRATLDLGCDPSDSVKAGPNRLLLRLLSDSFPTPVLLRPCSNPDVLLRSCSDPAPAPARFRPCSCSDFGSCFDFDNFRIWFSNFNSICYRLTPVPVQMRKPSITSLATVRFSRIGEAQGLESRRTQQFVYGDPAYHPGFGVMGPYPHTRNRPMNEERLVFNKHMASLRRCVEWGSDQ
jgi:hypothetical protein